MDIRENRAMELESGIAAFETKNFAHATKLLSPIAEEGNPDAMYRMAIMLQNGLGCLANEDKALISKKLVTLKNDAPINRDLDEFELKEINKDKLYKFLREMEFNRLLSSAISVYGEPDFTNEISNKSTIILHFHVSL